MSQLQKGWVTDKDKWEKCLRTVSGMNWHSLKLVRQQRHNVPGRVAFTLSVQTFLQLLVLSCHRLSKNSKTRSTLECQQIYEIGFHNTLRGEIRNLPPKSGIR